MLKRFLGPRWQHPDVEVRRGAVEVLSAAADGDALAQVAREDASPAIRRLALRRAADLDLLSSRAADDEDATVREHAERRFRELLAGRSDDAPPLAQRLERAARSDNPGLIEYLAREGADEALRAHALGRVVRETVLRDVALGDASPELRLEALDRIEDEAILARVHERSRKTDKRVSHAARERLDALREARDRPQQVAAESARLCEIVEGLGRDGHWERDAERLALLEPKWHELDAGFRAPFEARYAAASERFLSGLEGYRAAASDARRAREAVIESLEALATPPEDAGAVPPGWAEAREAALREARARWDAGTPVPAEDEERALDERLQRARAAVRAALERPRTEGELERLLEEHERLAATDGAIAETDVKALGRALEAIALPDARDPALRALAERLELAHRSLRDRVRGQADWKKDTLGGLDSRLDALRQAVTDGHASEAGAAWDALSKDVDELLAAGTAPERVAKPRKRLAAMAREIKVMRAWGRAGARAAAERLCEQMEALKDSEQTPPEIAKQVRAARDAWKALAKSGGGADRALWRRFDKAASAAYEPCKAWFAERAGARKANLQRRRDVLEELEQLLASSGDAASRDWKATVRLRRDLLKRWHDAHPVERGPGKALAADFDARMSDLDALLGRERERCLRQREQLITEAEALAGGDDKKAAAEACKALQARWVVTVPGGRREENTLWERFRGACDAVFNERQQVFDAERAHHRAGLDEREALCRRAEALAGADADAMDDAEQELRRVQGEWARSAPLPRREGEALEKRFAAAVRRFSAHRRAVAAERREADLALMRRKAALCHDAECADGSAAADARAALEQSWQSLGTLADEDVERSLAQRFRGALDGGASGAPGDGAGDASSGESVATRESICLRLEILAGIDSPPEHARARMALQVERLASALKTRDGAGADTPQALLRDWCTCAPAPRTAARALEARFERAWSALPGHGTAGA